MAHRSAQAVHIHWTQAAHTWVQARAHRRHRCHSLAAALANYQSRAHGQAPKCDGTEIDPRQPQSAPDQALYPVAYQYLMGHRFRELQVNHPELSDEQRQLVLKQEELGLAQTAVAAGLSPSHRIGSLRGGAALIVG